MAVNVIGNQLVKLYTTEDFNTRNKKCTWDTRTYCQVVRPEQTTMFQVQVTPQTNDDLITNGDFSSGLDSWDGYLSGGQWSFSNGTVNGFVGSAFGINFVTSIIQTNIAVDANSFYCVEFNIDRTAGDVIGTVGVQTVPDYNNGASLAVTASGTYQVYFSSESSTYVNIILEVRGTTSHISAGSITWDYVKMVKLTTPVVTITDCNDVTKRTLTPFAQEQDRINYAIDWYGLTTETCYRVCITGVDDLDFNFLDYALALGTEGGAPIELEEGGFLKWFG